MTLYLYFTIHFLLIAESTVTINSVDIKPLESPTKCGFGEIPSNGNNTITNNDSPIKMDEDLPTASNDIDSSSPIIEDSPAKIEDKKRDEAATREELQQIVFRIMNINSQIRYSEARFTIDPAVLANALEALDAKNYREFCAEIFIEVVKEFYEGKLIQSGDGSTSGTFSDNWNSIPPKKVKPIDIEEVLEKSGGSTAMEIDADIRLCTSKPSMKSFSSNRVAALDYLINCYCRANDEVYSYTKIKKSKKMYLAEILPDVAAVIRQQTLKYAILLTKNRFQNFAQIDNPAKLILEKSPLLQLMYENKVS